MASSQIGKTESFINNPIGYYIHQDAAPILLIQPTLELARTWSKDRFVPMLRDTPALKELVRDPRSKDSDNTILHKVFPGGHITMAGANSAASLAMRPIRILFFDEVDKYPESVGTEGDPISLAGKRATTFWNRKKAYCSSPTVKDISRIEGLFEGSDKRYYNVPCPVCDTLIVLKWGGPDADFGVKWDKDKPETAYYVCQECGGVIEEGDKPRMLTRGKWIATAEFKGKAGFHINELYSPWVTWAEMVKDFLEKKKLPETLKTFVNLSLGETWEEQGDQVDEGPLLARREHYGPKIPSDILLVTAGIDVQDDRLEIEVTGWGLDMENWLIDYIVLPGDIDKKTTKTELDDQLARTFETEDGGVLHIVTACIDSGGHRTQAVYDYVKKRERRRIYAIKGVSSLGHPVIKRPKEKNKKGITLHSVGADQTKELVYGHLKVINLGPGYCHFPFEGVQTAHPIDGDYFKGLTAEKCVTRYLKGFPKREWIQVRKYNEPLDCRVYSYAAFYNLNANMKALSGKREQQVVDAQAVAAGETKAKAEAKTKTKKLTRGKKGGFVTSWS